jgi:hypothetical protein
MLKSRSSSTTTTHHQNVNEFEFAEQEQTAVASTINHRRAKALTPSLTTSQTRLGHGMLTSNCGIASESDISSVLQLQLRNKKLNRNRNYAYVRRKVRWNSNTSAMLLLMLMCLVVKMELVIGALSINYNSVNYYDNSTTFSDDSDLVPFLNDDENQQILTNRSPSSISSRPPVIYHNEFALYIPSGLLRANEIAEKYGFVNMGQVSNKFIIVIAKKIQTLTSLTSSMRRAISYKLQNKVRK